MLTFVMLEDNINTTKIISKIINKVMMNNKIQYQVFIFKNITEELLELTKNECKNKIYILNSNLSKDLTKIIRENDWNSVIILTKNDINETAIYKRLLILDTILIDKSLEKNLNELLKISIDKLKINRNIIIKKKSCEYRMCIDEALYIYKDKRKSIILTEEDKVELFDNLKNINSLLNNTLIQIHKSCYINPKRIYKIDYKNKLIIFDNKVICELVSPLYLKNLKSIR